MLPDKPLKHEKECFQAEWLSTPVIRTDHKSCNKSASDHSSPVQNAATND